MKKHIVLWKACIGSTLLAFGQPEDSFLLQQYSPEISFVVMDSIHGSQSTVIEYNDFLVVIEMPMVDEGGSKTEHLEEDAGRATRYREFLREHFNRKPIRYILSSHWHQHSLSGVTPFTDEGTRIITTRKNWDYAVAHDLVAKEKLPGLGDKIIFVAADTLLLERSEFPIEVLYLDSTYSNKPTTDYLFFYLTRQKYLHASCMTAVGQSDLGQQGPHIYGSRLIDVRRVIAAKKLDVEKIIRLGREDFVHRAFQPGIYNYADVAAYIESGRSPQEALKPYVKMPIDRLRQRMDQVLDEFAAMRLGPGMLNGLVYEFIEDGDYDRAVVFAQLLNLYYPGILDFIDTLGEAYYFAGDVDSARRMSIVLLGHDEEYDGGMEVWEKNRKEQTGH